MEGRWCLKYYDFFLFKPADYQTDLSKRIFSWLNQYFLSDIKPELDQWESVIRIILFISVILLSGRINRLQYPGLLKPSFVFSSLFFDQSCPHVLQIVVTLSKQEKSNVLRKQKHSRGSHFRSFSVHWKQNQCKQNRVLYAEVFRWMSHVV